MIVRVTSILFLISAIATISGCGGSDLIKVTGSVKVDGTPLTTGRIDFEPADGKGATASEIIDATGSYTAMMPPGKKLIRISANRVIGKRPAYGNNPNGPQVEIVEPLIPSSYNNESKDVREILTPQTIDFSLEGVKAGAK